MHRPCFSAILYGVTSDRGLCRAAPEWIRGETSLNSMSTVIFAFPN